MKAPATASRYALVAVASILLFDVAEALVARASGWTYLPSNIGSLAIYAAVGFLTGRRFSIKAAVAVTALTGAAESTFGWVIAWAVGPGRQPSVLARPALAAGVALTVVVIAALIGFLAGLLGVWVREGAAHDDGPE